MIQATTVSIPFYPASQLALQPRFFSAGVITNPDVRGPVWNSKRAVASNSKKEGDQLGGSMGQERVKEIQLWPLTQSKAFTSHSRVAEVLCASTF